MAVKSPEGAATQTAMEGPATSRALGSLPVRLLTRFLALREGSIVVVALVTFAYFALTTTNFLTYASFQAMLPYFAFLAVMAGGEVFVMTLGEIDLSIGALYLITPFIYWKFTESGIPLVPSLLLSLVVAGVAGAINGFFTAYIGIASFVVTLAMLFFLDGVTLIISHSEQISTPGTSVVHTSTFANVLGVGKYSELIWAIGIVVVLQIVLSFTRWGVYTVATGGNRLAAAEAGINVRLVIVRNFVISAMCGGFSGLLESIRTSSMSPDPSGSNFNLFLAVASVIIGGTLMTGGEGTVVGMFIGALFIGILQDGLVIKSVNASYEDMYIGIAVIIAMVIYVLVRRVRIRSGRA